MNFKDKLNSKGGPVKAIYATDEDAIRTTGMAITLAVHVTDRNYGLSVYNVLANESAFVVVSRDELAGLRDAINKELAS